MTTPEDLDRMMENDINEADQRRIDGRCFRCGDVGDGGYFLSAWWCAPCIDKAMSPRKTVHVEIKLKGPIKGV